MKDLNYYPQVFYITFDELPQNRSGQDGLNFLVQMFEGYINKCDEKENLLKEFLFAGQQKLLKQIHKLKNELKDSEWS